MDAALFGTFGAALPLAAFVVVAVAEMLWPARRSDAPIGRRWFGNLALYLLSGGLLLLPMLAAFSAAVTAGAARFGLLNWVSLPAPLHIVLGVLGLDALSYGIHRLAHAVGVIWRLHAVHHSDTEVDVTTSIRHHPLEALVGSVLAGAGVLAMGCSPLEVAIYAALDWVVGLVAHTDLALAPRLEAALGFVFVTPSFHRLHHSRVMAETDSNYGQVFAFWDTLFGTVCRRAPAGARPLEFGLDEFREQKFQRLHWLLAQPLVPRAAQASGTTRNRSVSPVS